MIKNDKIRRKKICTRHFDVQNCRLTIEKGLIFAMVGQQFWTYLRIEMVSTDLLWCFLPFFIIYLTVKWFLPDFFFLISLSLSPVLIQNESFIGVT